MRIGTRWAKSPWKMIFLSLSIKNKNLGKTRKAYSEIKTRCRHEKKIQIWLHFKMFTLFISVHIPCFLSSSFSNYWINFYTCTQNVLSEHMCVKRVWYLYLACWEQFKRSSSITTLYTYFPDITCNSSWYLCCEEAVLIVFLVHLKW